MNNEILATRTCKKCNAKINRVELDKNYSICTNCGNYMRFHAQKRIKSLADPGTFREWAADLNFAAPVDDDAYEKQILNARQKHKLKEAIIIGKMKLNNIPIAVGVMDTRFIMASMGYIVGEKVTLLFEKAIAQKLPVILFCCSGGARMQEGMISLMQMEKTAAAVERHNKKGLLYISVLTNPTMGGVTASYATIADIVLAEKGATVGFAGNRVIKQNTGVELPENFQTAEFLKDHGFIDAIIERKTTREFLGRILTLHKKNNRIPKSEKRRKLLENIKIENEITTWEKVQISRSKNRPTSREYIEYLFDEFIEFSGDRVMKDDHAVIAGIASFHKMPVTVIGQQKGKDSLEQSMYYNWGMASPSGYRKALRIMKQGEKFGRPIICFIDTIGADCGENAERYGQGAVIAELLREMSVLKVPILSIIISEGNSGGALALCVSNEVWMLENSVYSILSPEGYASIVWKDASRAEEASEVMKMDAQALLEEKIIDKVIKEKTPIEKDNIKEVCEVIDAEIKDFIKKYSKMFKNRIVKQRYKRFRKF